MKILFGLLLSLQLFSQSWSVVYVSSSLHLKKSDLKNIYFKKMRQKEGQSIIAINLLASHPARLAFLKKVLGSDLHNWDLYYDEMYFMGLKSPPVVKSTLAMKKYLLNVEGAVGYLPSKDLSNEYIELLKFDL